MYHFKSNTLKHTWSPNLDWFDWISVKIFWTFSYNLKTNTIQWVWHKKKLRIRYRQTQEHALFAVRYIALTHTVTDQLCKACYPVWLLEPSCTMKGWPLGLGLKKQVKSAFSCHLPNHTMMSEPMCQITVFGLYILLHCCRTGFLTNHFQNDINRSFTDPWQSDTVKVLLWCCWLPT